jgi:hypothetical protein
MFRLLITGSRAWSDKEVVVREMVLVARKFGQDVTLVSGNASKGGDAICESIAKDMGWVIERHPAKWNRQEDGSYDNRAGFKRNKFMVMLGADACLAFIKDGSAGATNTAVLAELAGIPTKRVEA